MHRGTQRVKAVIPRFFNGVAMFSKYFGKPKSYEVLHFTSLRMQILPAIQEISG